MLSTVQSCNIERQALVCSCVYGYMCVDDGMFVKSEDNTRGCFSGTFYLLFETRPLSDLELHQIGHASWPVSCKELSPPSILLLLEL